MSSERPSSTNYSLHTTMVQIHSLIYLLILCVYMYIHETMRVGKGSF